jgi:succinyl-diaminopimelate desuccinylase
MAQGAIDLRADEDPLVRLLAELVARDTTNPPGHEREICAFLEGYLGEAGITTRTMEFEPGRASICAELPGREPGAFLLSAHLDTVKLADGWHTDPLLLTEAGGRLYGLGACDMKGGVVAMVRAFLEVARRGKPRHALRLLLSADEEIHYRGASQFQREGLTDGALFAIVAEPSAGKILVGERGEFWVGVHFTGKEAHGSTPHEGVSAVQACARFLAAVEARMKSAPPIAPFGPTTFNAGRIAGGRQVNIVADGCMAELDFRVGSEAERDRIAALLDEEGARATQAGGSYRRETISWVKSFHTDADEPYVAALRRAYRETLGREAEISTAPYCTDQPSLFPGDYPPCVIFGPGDIAQAHQPNEYTTRESLREVSAVVNELTGTSPAPLT